MTQNIRISESEFKKEYLLVIDIAMRVHKNLGYGLKDDLYKNAFEAELKSIAVQYQRNRKYQANLNGLLLEHNFYADFTLDEKVIFEIKSFPEEMMNDYATVFDHLVCSAPMAGLIINFNKPLLQFKKVKLSFMD